MSGGMGLAGLLAGVSPFRGGLRLAASYSATATSCDPIPSARAKNTCRSA